MLRNLSIKNILLIENLELEFSPGLGVLTGETGSGKSILLDALSLVIGARADTELIRQGEEKSVVVAEFELSNVSKLNHILEEYGITIENNFALRRLISADGRSRAFVNDQPVSVAVLRSIGELIVEIHGQLETHSLLDPSIHRTLLDSYGDYDNLLSIVSKSYKDWRSCISAYEKASLELEKGTEEIEFHSLLIKELEELNFLPGEDEELSRKRRLLMNSERLVEGLGEILAEADQTTDIPTMLNRIIQKLVKLADLADDQFDNVIKSFERGLLEVNEGFDELQKLSDKISLDPLELERVEERLFKIRGLARKYEVEVEQLPTFLAKKISDHSLLADANDSLDLLQEKVQQAKQKYYNSAEILSKARSEAIIKLDQAITDELVPLRLEDVHFRTSINELPETSWNEFGVEAVHFEVQTNPNTAFGPIQKVASGGELARIMLALKVVLANAYAIPTIIFDEVDSGIGGATAAAVGSRLSRLSEEAQVLVVTHSPQVAALGRNHFYINKFSNGNGNVTQVQELSGNIRQEEIARMLSGEKITNEARAAAASLIQSGNGIKVEK